MHASFCSLLRICPEGLHLGQTGTSLQYTASSSAVCNCTLPRTGSAIAHASGVVDTPQFACRLLDAEGWHWAPSIRKRRIDCCCCSVEVAQPVASSSRQLWSGRPLITACRKSPMRLCLCLSLERFLSLVIGGFSSWNFSKTPEAALVFAQL